MIITREPYTCHITYQTDFITKFILFIYNLNYYCFMFQFWAAYAPCEAQFKDAVQITIEQIDVIKRLTERYSPQLTPCTTALGRYQGSMD